MWHHHNFNNMKIRRRIKKYLFFFGGMNSFYIFIMFILCKKKIIILAELNFGLICYLFISIYYLLCSIIYFFFFFFHCPCTTTNTAALLCLLFFVDKSINHLSLSTKKLVGASRTRPPASRVIPSKRWKYTPSCVKKIAIYQSHHLNYEKVSQHPKGTTLAVFKRL